MHESGHRILSVVLTRRFETSLGSDLINFMTVIGTKLPFGDDSRNDRFGVLSGSSEHQCLLLGVERTEIGHRVFGCC